MSDNETDQYKAYQEDTRIPCRYGAKCYQKNALHMKNSSTHLQKKRYCYVYNLLCRY